MSPSPSPSVPNTLLVLTDFSGIELRRNMAENTIIAPSEVSFTISNIDNTLNFEDFIGGNVLIELWLANTEGIATKITGWNFRIKSAKPGYQNLNIIAEDFLEELQNGKYRGRCP
jgi:hypothetical protein